MQVSLKFAGRILVVLAFFALYGCSDEKSAPATSVPEPVARVVNVTVSEVVPTVIRDVLTLPGQTEPWQDVRVAADTGGVVEWIGVEEGDRVSKNDLLAKIDVQSLKAVLDRATAAYELADSVCKRRESLFSRGIITEEDLDKSLTERTLAKGDLRQAKVEYNRGFVRSSISGVVNELFVDQGEFIDRGSPLSDIVDVEKIKINVNVPEMDIRFLKVGQKTVVTVDALREHSFFGVIDFVAFKADPATKTFLVKVVVDNEDHLIRPGMIARVSFLRRVIPDALTAPIFALLDKSGERVLYVEEDGIAKARTVQIGVLEGAHVEIVQGLFAGDHLIVAGQNEVEEGTRVSIQ